MLNMFEYPINPMTERLTHMPRMQRSGVQISDRPNKLFYQVAMHGRKQW